VTVLTLAVVLLSLRLELYRRIAQNPECTVPTVEIWLPLLLALYDSLQNQKYRQTDGTEKIDNTVYESLIETARRNLLSTRFRYVLPTTLFCWGCQFLLRLWNGLNSTYICPVVTGEHTSVPAAQVFGLLADAALLIVVWQHFPTPSRVSLTPRRNVVLWASTMLGTVGVWIIGGAIVYQQKHRMRYYVVLWDVDTFPVLCSMALQALLVSVTFVTTMHSVSHNLSPKGSLTKSGHCLRHDGDLLNSHGHSTASSECLLHVVCRQPFSSFFKIGPNVVILSPLLRMVAIQNDPTFDGAVGSGTVTAKADLSFGPGRTHSSVVQTHYNALSSN
jgi:hypothetical protein